MKLEMLSSNCECSCDLVKILLWRGERSRSYRIALESEILKTEKRRLSWILLLNLLENIIHYHVDAKDADINQHFRTRRCSLRVLFLNFPTTLDERIREHALSDHRAEDQYSLLTLSLIRDCDQSSEWRRWECRISNRRCDRNDKESLTCADSITDSRRQRLNFHFRSLMLR